MALTCHITNYMMCVFRSIERRTVRTPVAYSQKEATGRSVAVVLGGRDPRENPSCAAALDVTIKFHKFTPLCTCLLFSITAKHRDLAKGPCNDSGARAVAAMYLMYPGNATIKDFLLNGYAQKVCRLWFSKMRGG